jgi:hypothetical protein
LIKRERLRIITHITTVIGRPTMRKTAKKLFQGGFEVGGGVMTELAVTFGVDGDVGVGSGVDVSVGEGEGFGVGEGEGAGVGEGEGFGVGGCVGNGDTPTTEPTSVE